MNIYCIVKVFNLRRMPMGNMVYLYDILSGKKNTDQEEVEQL